MGGLRAAHVHVVLPWRPHNGANTSHRAIGAGQEGWERFWEAEPLLLITSTLSLQPWDWQQSPEATFLAGGVSKHRETADNCEWQQQRRKSAWLNPRRFFLHPTTLRASPHGNQFDTQRAAGSHPRTGAPQPRRWRTKRRMQWRHVNFWYQPPAA